MVSVGQLAGGCCGRSGFIKTSPSPPNSSILICPPPPSPGISCPLPVKDGLLGSHLVSAHQHLAESLQKLLKGNDKESIIHRQKPHRFHILSKSLTGGATNLKANLFHDQSGVFLSCVFYDLEQNLNLFII